MRRGTRVVEDVRRSTGFDEAAFDSIAVVSSPGGGLPGPTSAFRTPCRCCRTALCTKPSWFGGFQAILREDGRGVVTGNGDGENIQRGRSAKQPSTSENVKEELVDTERCSTSGLYRSALNMGFIVGNLLMNPTPRRSDDLETWSSPRLSQVRNWVILTARVLTTGICLNLTSPISLIAVNYIGYRVDAVR